MGGRQGETEVHKICGQLDEQLHDPEDIIQPRNQRHYPRECICHGIFQLLDNPLINRVPEYLRETEILRYLGIESIDTGDLYESLQERNDMDFSAM